MIITKTPLRISLAGGGTDMPEFYKENKGGAVVSFAIDKYIYVAVNKKFDSGVRVSYSITENVDEPEHLKHDLVREALKQYNANGMEVVSIADVPGGGTGLGSSSSFSVGLLLALNRYFDKPTNRHPCVLADAAYYLERGLAGHHVGKQDHYAAAYGGLRFYEFENDESTIVRPIKLSENNLAKMQYYMQLFYLGKTRHAGNILKEQAKNIKDGWVDIMELKNGAYRLFDDLDHDNISNIGEHLRNNWFYKKQMAMGISSKEIESYYNCALTAGAEGGKLCGAGGAGFLLFYSPYKYHEKIRKALGLREVPFKISNEGAQIIYDDGGRA